MTRIDIAIALLGVSCGFASTVWSIVGWASVRTRQWWPVLGYIILIGACLFGTVLVAAILINRPIDLPMGTSTFVLIPLVAIPPALQLRSWALARKVVVVELVRREIANARLESDE